MSKEKLANAILNPDGDFWKDATSFMIKHLPENFKDIQAAFMKEKGYNLNEAQLFRHYCASWVDFEGCFGIIMHDVGEEPKDKEDE